MTAVFLSLKMNSSSRFLTPIFEISLHFFPICFLSPDAGCSWFVRPARAVVQPSLSPPSSPEHPFSQRRCWISGAKRKTDFRAKKASDFRREARRAVQFPEKPLVLFAAIACSTLLSLLSYCVTSQAVPLIVVFVEDIFDDTNRLNTA